MAVVVETTVGDFTIDLYIKDRPRTCLNFLKLCKQHYYNFNLLFSIERNFVAQTGDPTGSGRGGNSIFQSMFGEQARLYEGEKLPVLRHTQLGTVSMATCGSHTFGSQFFITLGDDLDSLDEEHLVFGHVSEGLDVIAKLNDVLTDEKNRPYQDIRICHTVVLDDPFPDPDELVFPDESPRPTPEVLASDYIAVDESVEDTAGKDMSEIQEEIAAKEAEARATILEMVGDLPDADTAPPENVLFVCKLNPVTTSEDLEIIFSRFGKINCAEVIKDRITGNSLQYAFIEFDETKSCEDAYFKMDNVLIDDRRIHVDFSQSVSKIKWKGKGRGVELYDDKGKKIDKKENDQFNSKTRDGFNKKDEAAKSRFIDTEAYSKRYKERQEAYNDKGASHRNGERRPVGSRGQSRNTDDQEVRKRAGQWDESRSMAHGDDGRYDENRRRDRDHRDKRVQDDSRAHCDGRDGRDRRQDNLNYCAKDSRDTRRKDYDDRRDQRRLDHSRADYSRENRQQDYNRDQRKYDFSRENTDHRLDRRDQSQRVRHDSVERAAPGSEDGAQDGRHRHKMMAMLRSELGGGNARSATSGDASDSDSSSTCGRQESKKKASKKKKRAVSVSSQSSESERGNKKKRRDSSSDSEDYNEKRKMKKRKHRDSDDGTHERKKNKKKKKADSSSDKHTKRKKSKKNKK